MLIPLLVGCGPGFPPDQDQLVVHELELIDDSRDTPALGDLPGASERVLRTLVWVGPATGEEAAQRPLLLMAHGVDGHPDKFMAFASALAEAGVVVAAPAFPATNRDSGAGYAGIGDLPEQPADLRFVLDRLLEAGGDETSDLWSRFDPERIAAMGHSLGGATLLGLTRFGDGEPRIEAQVYLSPAVPLTSPFGSVVEPSGPPTLLMHGLDDTTLDASISEDLYQDLEDPRWYLGLSGAGHSDPIESQDEPPIPSREAAQDAVKALIAQVFLGEDGAVDRILDELAAEGHTVLP